MVYVINRYIGSESLEYAAVDVEFPDSDSRIEDCVMEEDFPFSIYGTSDWEISYKRGDLTFKEWEDGE